MKLPLNPVRQAICICLLSVLTLTLPASAAADEPQPLTDAEFAQIVIYNGNTDKIRAGIAQKLSLNHKVGGRPLFSYLVENLSNDPSVLDVISSALTGGADPNLPDASGLTPVMVAAGLRSAAMMKLFLSHGKINWDSRTSSGETILMLAQKNSDREVLPLLLGAKPPASCVNAQGADGRTLLTRAVTTQRAFVKPEMLDLLHQAGADFNARSENGLSVLQEAFADGKEISCQGTTIDALIKNGARPDTKDAKGRTALHFLLEYSLRGSTARMVFDKLTAWFAAAKADINTKDADGNTALHRLFLLQKAAGHNSGLTDECKVLIAAGADVSAVNQDGASVLMAAAAGGYGKCVQMLLEAGADVKAANPDQVPLLFYAISGDLPADIITRLIEAGCPAECRDSAGRTALIYALLSSAEDRVIKALLDGGASATTTDSEGRTPLMAMAAFDPMPRIAEYLIKAGAAPEVTDREGKTALDYLRASPYSHTKEYARDLESLEKLLTSDSKESASEK